MSYAIEPRYALDAEVQRIAKEQIGKAMDSLTDLGDDAHDAIHDARKRLKKLRGLVRLIRPAMEGFYQTQNALWRDTARSLSDVRDKAALAEAIEKLEAHFADEVATDAFTPFKAKLVAERDAEIERGAGELQAQVETAKEALTRTEAAFDGHAFAGRKHRPKRDARIAAAGVAKTYARAHTALKTAQTTRDAHDLHELRKRTKYHWMHLRLLTPLWPAGFASALDLAKQVADDLGDDHDLAVMRGRLEAEPEGFGGRNHLSVVLALIDRRQADLREAGLAGARILLAETPEAIDARFQRLYRLAARKAETSDKLPSMEPKAQLRVAIA